MNMAYGLYMAEANGMLDTKESKIQKAIGILKKVHGEVSYEVFLDICEDCGLEVSSLSKIDYNRLMRATER
jgi:hypothetical protein